MYVTTAFNDVYALDARTGRAALALQARHGADHHLLLRTEQPRRRRLRRHGLPRHARRAARRARRQDRQAGLGAADRRPGARLQRDDGADGRRRQDPDRHQRRRVRHPRLREGVRRQDRRPALDLQHRSRRTPSASGRRTTPPAATCTATSRRRRRRSRRTAIPTRRSAAACGRTRRSISRRGGIYFVVGNPSPDLDGAIRPGDNLYTDSPGRGRPRHRQVRLPLPVHRARRLGPRRGQPADHHHGQGRQRRRR